VTKPHFQCGLGCLFGREVIRNQRTKPEGSKQDSNQRMHFICIAFSRRETRAKLRRARSGEFAARNSMSGGRRAGCYSDQVYKGRASGFQGAEPTVAVADMAKSSIDIAESLAGLSTATIFELRGEWRRLHRASPPMRLSHDLLMRGITYKLQERPLGGLSKSIIRKLERLNLDSEASDAQKPAPPISLKAGTRLVREWRGATYTVHAGGFEWNGRRYRSLTIVSREITGAHWSSPRFFGLRKRAGRSVESAEGEHAEA
jgi:hypothetical protein